MHPTLSQLIDYVLDDGQAAPDRDRIALHLREECGECEGRLREVETLVEAMRSDRTPEPPAAWVARAVALARTPLDERVRDWLDGVVEKAARLVFDSRAEAELGLVGVRRAETGRRLRFEAKDVELDLQIESGARVTGQLVRLGPETRPLEGASVLLTSGRDLVAERKTNEFGEFTVEVSDVSDLRIRVAGEGQVLGFTVPEPPSS